MFRHCRAVEREPGFRAIPVDEFLHGMLIRSTRLEGCQTIQDGPLGPIELGQCRPVPTLGLLLIRTLHKEAASYAASPDIQRQLTSWAVLATYSSGRVLDARVNSASRDLSAPRDQLPGVTEL